MQFEEPVPGTPPAIAIDGLALHATPPHHHRANPSNSDMQTADDARPPPPRRSRPSGSRLQFSKSLDNLQPAEPQPPPIWKMLLMNGEKVRVNIMQFRKHQDTLLGRMFAENQTMVKPNSNDEYEIECDGVPPELFRAILGFYDNGVMVLPSQCSVAQLRHACDFFLIPFTPKTVECRDIGELLQDLSNQGAKRRFEGFLRDELKPAMAESALTGDRECYVVLLMDDDILDWDDDCPPGVGEDTAQLVRNSDFVRFFHYTENRTLAKEVLEESGLKKVRVGIEGFPTCKERVKWGSSGKPVIEYQYAQRPFLRVSWELDEHKSRRVEFQVVTGRSRRSSAGGSMTNILSALAGLPADQVDQVDQIDLENIDNVHAVVQLQDQEQ